MIHPVAAGDDISALADSLMIRIEDLYGINSVGEFGNSAAEDTSKFASAFLLTLQDKLAQLSNPLGVSVTKANPTGAGNDLIRQNLSVNWSYVIDFAKTAVKVFPLDEAQDPHPKRVTLLDIFPNIEMSSNSGSSNTSNYDAIYIQLVDLGEYNPAISQTVGFSDPPTYGWNVDNDCRQVLEAMTRMIFQEAQLRNSTTASAITNKTKSNVSGANAPSNFFADTSYTELEANELGWFNINYSLTFEYLLGHNPQTFDLNVVTA